MASPQDATTSAKELLMSKTKAATSVNASKASEGMLDDAKIDGRYWDGKRWREDAAGNTCEVVENYANATG